MVQILRHMTRLIAGVIVPDTPLINASIALAQENLPTNGFNHVMRAWLNGQAIINHLSIDNRSVIDVEAFGVATILHDLGWYVPTLLLGSVHSVISIPIYADEYRAFNTSFVSNEKWFEVDGAQAARDFIRNVGGSGWDEHRLQLVWDAIALHTNPNIAKFKQPEVAFTSAGTFSEVVGPELAKQQFVQSFLSLVSHHNHYPGSN
jgi:hypothetical protein